MLDAWIDDQETGKKVCRLCISFAYYYRTLLTHHQSVTLPFLVLWLPASREFQKWNLQMHAHHHHLHIQNCQGPLQVLPICQDHSDNQNVLCLSHQGDLQQQEGSWWNPVARPEPLICNIVLGMLQRVRAQEASRVERTKQQIILSNLIGMIKWSGASKQLKHSSGGA